MIIDGANVLITGGSEGIGYGLAARFLKAGSRVLVTGRDAAKLAKAASELPSLKTYVSDMGKIQDREALAQYVASVMTPLHWVINNAGIQRRISLAQDKAPWSERQQEMDILLSGPIHLNHLLIPLLLQHKWPSRIVNVTSGGAFIPQPFAPVYSACKAALHSYTMTLRYALANTSCGVVELIPPAVMTNLAGNGQQHGADLDAFCDHVFQSLLIDGLETVGYGPTEQLEPQLSEQSVTKLFETSASRFPVDGYSQG
ncbi:SDR family NAD(P)-dependent oxidoreductase [Larkinella knui]|uniref:SDR family NAD(P)-dependent oxidoreductase n=1 Tax=Larkinella knui TaxID=2025310 RepID=A0A3P1CAY6_9BACT|nr:SDR family NAD(P)-dependent oxidoreductase [Larkinella knui]RRB10489.1 SDR family NAD(P)-dependent oxidoreductase [Larkinella knui]